MVLEVLCYKMKIGLRLKQKEEIWFLLLLKRFVKECLVILSGLSKEKVEEINSYRTLLLKIWYQKLLNIFWTKKFSTRVNKHAKILLDCMNEII